jgi:hypothetical protein
MFMMLRQIVRNGVPVCLAVDPVNSLKSPEEGCLAAGRALAAGKVETIDAIDQYPATARHRLRLDILRLRVPRLLMRWVIRSWIR